MAHGGGAVAYDRLVGVEAEGEVAAFDVDFGRGAELAGGVFEARFHVRALGVELFVGEAARLGGEFDAVGDDVGGAAAGDLAEVGGGFVVDAQEFHAIDRACGDLDGVDACLRLEAGVRRAAVDDGVDRVLGRPAHEDLADRPVGVEDEGAFRPDLAVVEAHCAVHADLFADREYGLDQPVPDAAFANAPHAFKYGGNSGLVIAAEDRLTVGANDPVLDDGCHADARGDGVHVAGEDDRFDLRIAGQGGDQVAGVAAGQFAGGVKIDGEAERFQFGFEVSGQAAFLPRWAGDLRHGDELVDEALRVLVGEHG